MPPGQDRSVSPVPYERRPKRKLGRRATECCGEGRFAGAAQPAHSYERRSHRRSSGRSKVKVIGGFYSETFLSCLIGEGGALEAGDLGPDQRPVRLVEAKQRLGQVQAGGFVAGDERVDRFSSPETLQVHQQKGEVARHVGAAQRAVELYAVEDLYRAIRLQADVLSPKIALPLPDPTLLSANVEEVRIRVDEAAHGLVYQVKLRRAQGASGEGL